MLLKTNFVPMQTCLTLTNLLKHLYNSDVLSFQVLSKYVNALLNTKGGMLVFGVEPSGELQCWKDMLTSLMADSSLDTDCCYERVLGMWILALEVLSKWWQHWKFIWACNNSDLFFVMLNSELSGLGLRPCWGLCVLLSGVTLYSLLFGKVLWH